MLNANDRTLNAILIKMQDCISSGSVSEYMTIADEITVSVNNPLAFLSHSFGFGFPQNGMIDYNTVTFILSDYFRSFAAKYPEQFSQFDFTKYSEAIISDAAIEIMKNSKAAYSLTDMIIPIIKSTPSNYSKLLYAAAIGGNDIMFEYISARSDISCKDISYDLALYLFEEGKCSLLDIIFKNSDRDEIVGFGKEVYMRSPYTKFQNYFRLFYEITLRYLADTSNKNEIAVIASDFFEEIDIFSSVFAWNNIFSIEFDDEWDFLAEHGIKMRNITPLLDLDYSSTQARNDIKKLILPHLDDKVYFDVQYASYKPQDKLRNITDLIGLIGADRIYLLIRDNIRLVELSEFTPHLSLSWITKTDLEVRFDDNIIRTKMILSILNSPSVLKFILKQNKLSDVQMNELIDLCIKQKDMKSLNIIRQFIKKT